MKPKQVQIAALTHLHLLKTQSHRVGERCVPSVSNSCAHYLGVQVKLIFLIHLIKKSCIYDVSKRRVWNKGNCTGTWDNRKIKCQHHSFCHLSCPTPVTRPWSPHLGVPRKFTLPPTLFLLESNSCSGPSSGPASCSGSLPQLLRQLRMLLSLNKCSPCHADVNSTVHSLFHMDWILFSQQALNFLCAYAGDFILKPQGPQHSAKHFFKIS